MLSFFYVERRIAVFALEVKTGGAAFRSELETDRKGDFILDPEATEIRRILRDVAKRLESGYDSGVIMDVNGNKVGWWKYQ